MSSINEEGLAYDIIVSDVGAGKGKFPATDTLLLR